MMEVSDSGAQEHMLGQLPLPISHCSTEVLSNRVEKPAHALILLHFRLIARQYKGDDPLELLRHPLPSALVQLISCGWPGQISYLQESLLDHLSQVLSSVLQLISCPPPDRHVLPYQLG